MRYRTLNSGYGGRLKLTEINKEMVESRLLQLKQYLAILLEQKKLSWEDFQKNTVLNMGIIHLLQVSIQLIIDIANHILSRTTHEVPDETKQIFEFLTRANLIPEENAQKYRNMVQFRNLVVHYYVDIKLNRVYEILQRSLPDFQIFIDDIQRILKGAKQVKT